MHHRMPPPKNLVAQFKHGDFSTCDVPCPVWPKTVTTPDIIDQIHELILEDHRISAKPIAEQLGISRERVGSIIHEDLDMRKLSMKWVLKCLNADKKRQWCQSSEHLLEFFRHDPNDLGSRRHPPHWLSSKRLNHQHRVLLISAGATEGHFEGKTRREVTKGVLFLHDNAPAQRTLATQKKLAFQCLDHPPYSPDLAPLFPGLKKNN